MKKKIERWVLILLLGVFAGLIGKFALDYLAARRGATLQHSIFGP